MNYHLKRLLAIILVSALFGVLVAVLKGGEAGVRDSLGNISAPWLLLPYFVGTMFRGPVRGAVMGTAASLIALAAFYISQSVVLDLGQHPWLTDLILTLGAGRQYYLGALLSGPLLGAIGGGAPTGRRFLVTAGIVGLSLVGEPLVVFAWQSSHGVGPEGSGMVIHYPALWAGEIALGLVLAAVIVTRPLQGRISRGAHNPADCDSRRR